MKITVVCLAVLILSAGCDDQAKIRPIATQEQISEAIEPWLVETGTAGGIFTDSDGGTRQVVYLVDRSGSMSDTFNAIRREVVISFGKLPDKCYFQIIFYAADSPIECPRHKLARADDTNKQQAYESARAIRPLGQGNPVPALKRAFETLGKADKKADGKFIHFISDGRFPDNKQVLKTIRRLNRDKCVIVNTYLYGQCPPVAVAVMKRIAAENGGRYKYVIGD